MCYPEGALIAFNREYEQEQAVINAITKFKALDDYDKIEIIEIVASKKGKLDWMPDVLRKDLVEKVIDDLYDQWEDQIIDYMITH